MLTQMGDTFNRHKYNPCPFITWWQAIFMSVSDLPKGTIDTEQRYAIKRIHSIAEYWKDKSFVDKSKCEVINRVYDLTRLYLRDHPLKEK